MALPNGYCSCQGIIAVDVGRSSEPICEYRGEEAAGVRVIAAYKSHSVIHDNNLMTQYNNTVSTTHKYHTQSDISFKNKNY